MLDLKIFLLFEGISLQLSIICAFLFVKMAELEKICFWKVGFFLGHILNANIIVWKLDFSFKKSLLFKKCMLVLVQKEFKKNDTIFRDIFRWKKIMHYRS